MVTNSTKLTNTARKHENELNCKIQDVLAKRVKLNNFSNGSNVQLEEVKVYFRPTANGWGIIAQVKSYPAQDGSCIDLFSSNSSSDFISFLLTGNRFVAMKSE